VPGEDHFGFGNGKETMGAIGMPIISERILDLDK